MAELVLREQKFLFSEDSQKQRKLFDLIAITYSPEVTEPFFAKLAQSTRVKNTEKIDIERQQVANQIPPRVYFQINSETL